MRLFRVSIRYFALLAWLAFAAGTAAQPANLPRIGWVLSATPENGRHLVEAMRAGLADEGLVDGRDVVLDIRYTAGRPERYQELFADLTRNPVTVLAAASLKFHSATGEFAF